MMGGTDGLVGVGFTVCLLSLGTWDDIELGIPNGIDDALDDGSDIGLKVGLSMALNVGFPVDGLSAVPV